MKKKQSHEETYVAKRIFNLKRVKNTIDLSESYSIINGKGSKELFESEIYKLSFAAQKQGNIHSVDLYLSSNEMICDDEAATLKEQLGIGISGDGSFLEIVDYQANFTMQFDQENSLFIASDEVKNGCVVFKK